MRTYGRLAKEPTAVLQESTFNRDQSTFKVLEREAYSERNRIVHLISQSKSEWPLSGIYTWSAPHSSCSVPDV